MLANELTLLSYIHQVAVQGKNTAVHRQEFYSLSQSPDEPIQAFVGRLHAKAAHCKFSCKCPNPTCNKNVSYSDAMVTDQMIVGVYGKDSQGEVLAKDASLPSFTEKFDLLQALGEGKRTQTHLNTSAISAHKSAYQLDKKLNQQKHHQVPPDSNQQPVMQQSAGQGRQRSNPQCARNTKQPQGCSGCGSTEHGRGTSVPRDGNCPHWDTTCTNCGKKGHVHHVCRGKSQSVAPPPPSGVAATLEDVSTLFGISSDDTSDVSPIPHMEWAGTQFVECSSPTIDIPASCIATIASTPAIPHMEWTDGRFTPCSPKKAKTSHSYGLPPGRCPSSCWA